MEILLRRYFKSVKLYFNNILTMYRSLDFDCDLTDQ